MSLETQASSDRLRARVALDTCRVVHAPDDRTNCFDLEVDTDESGQHLSLEGTVETERLLGLARSSVRDATGQTVTTRDVTVLESRERLRTLTTTAPVRADADDDAEQVTQALYGEGVDAYDRRGKWIRARAADGYVGWIDADHLTDGHPIEVDAVVAERIESGSTEPIRPGIECKVLDASGDEWLVEFRTGDQRRVPNSAVTRRSDTVSTDEAVACARSFLGTPYEWGGKTHEGIDCSGLVWIAYRSVGVTLPRDSDQQQEIGTEVDRDDLAPGDLLFFPGHVAMSLGGDEYIHAYGDAEGVVTNSFDPESDDYVADLDERFTVAKRVLDA
jgi:hypothetical protein